MGNPFDLAGHVALVTGGNSGIGLGMAEGLAAAGASVCIWGRTEERNEAARERLADQEGEALAVRCDVSSAEQVEAAFATTLERFGRIDSCFACAGVAPGGQPFLEMSGEEFHRVLGVNLTGAFMTLQGAARDMAKRGEGGSLVGVASLAAVSGQPRGQNYAASKGGLISMVNSCAVELAKHGIRANSILPGWIESAMTEGVLTAQPFVERVLPRIPARRWGTPADFAGVAVYLASQASAYHSGDTFIVDGGYRVF